jgi:hypothetical protein
MPFGLLIVNTLNKRKKEGKPIPNLVVPIIIISVIAIAIMILK